MLVLVYFINIRLSIKKKKKKKELVSRRAGSCCGPPRTMRTVVFDRIVKKLGLDPAAKERFLAGAIAGGTGVVRPVIKLFQAIIKGLNGYSVPGRGV